MISTQTVAQAPKRSAIAAFSAPIGGRQLSAVVHGLGRMVKHVASGCFVPYATLWEASFMVSLLQEPEIFEPDPFAGETPFLKDFWPRG
jgi:hypothetical protein